MMVDAIFWFTVAVAMIYLYQRTILPVFIERLRFKLYSLRDELRWLKITGAEIDPETFRYVQNSLNVSAKFVRIFDIGKMVRIAADLPPIDEEKLEAKMKLVNDCKEERVFAIVKDMKRIVKVALFLNSLILIAWSTAIIVPIVYVTISSKSIYSWCKNVINSMLTTPEPAFDRAVDAFQHPYASSLLHK